MDAAPHAIAFLDICNEMAHNKNETLHGLTDLLPDVLTHIVDSVRELLVHRDKGHHRSMVKKALVFVRQLCFLGEAQGNDVTPSSCRLWNSIANVQCLMAIIECMYECPSEDVVEAALFIMKVLAVKRPKAIEAVLSHLQTAFFKLDSDSEEAVTACYALWDEIMRSFGGDRAGIHDEDDENDG